MAKSVVLHIGTPKTGTTSIQHGLVDRRLFVHAPRNTPNPPPANPYRVTFPVAPFVKFTRDSGRICWSTRAKMSNVEPRTEAAPWLSSNA